MVYRVSSYTHSCRCVQYMSSNNVPDYCTVDLHVNLLEPNTGVEITHFQRGARTTAQVSIVQSYNGVHNDSNVRHNAAIKKNVL